MLAAWSVASRWQLWLRTLSRSEQRSYTAISLPLPSLSQANVVDAAPELAPKDPDVFEDRSSDYTLVARASLPPPPSIISLVEERLPKLLLQPLPGAVIFEDASVDLDYVASAPVEDTHNPSSTFHTLSNLVQAGQYDEAWDVLKDIQNLDLPIPFSPIYEAAAQAALVDSNLEPPQRAYRFTSWFSLIPPAHRATKRRKFLRTRGLIFHSSFANPDIATQAALILASKGYASLFIGEAIPFIMRYTPPNKSLDITLALEKANEAYWSGYKPQMLNHASKDFKKKLRGTTIKTLANSGHLEAALALLPDVSIAQATFRLTTRTYDVLLDALRGSLDSPAFAYIPVVETLRSRSIPSRIEESYKNDRDFHQHEMESLVLELDPQSSEYIGDSLARPLLHLTEALANKNSLPPVGTIANFLKDYVDSGRTGAVAKLRRLALNAHPKCAAHFLLAEMMYYKSQGLSQLILQLFTDHFYLSGVPRDEIVDHCRKADSEEFQESTHRALDIQATYDNQSQATFKSKALIRTPQNRRKLYNHLRVGKYNDQYRQKLWPTSAHRNLIWDSLLSLAQSDEAVERLYSKLLKFASREETAHDSATDTALSYLHTPATPTRVVGTRAFTPFLTRLLSKANPTRGADILSDMTQAGIIPSVHHFTQVAGFYARTGNASHAFLVLDMLEGQHPLVQEKQVEGEPERDAQNSMDSLPWPDLPLYTSVLRGFLMRRNVADALAVEARLRKRFIYTHGIHPPLDQALTHLRQLQREIDAPVGTVDFTIELKN